MNHPETREGIRRGFLLTAGAALVLLLTAMYLLRSKPGAPSSAAAAGSTAAVPVAAAKTVRASKTMRSAPTAVAVRIPPATLEEKLGLEVASIRLTAAGRGLDVRYRVVDQEKAASLDTPGNMSYLVDQVTGAKIGTSQPPPPLELHKPTSDRIYYVMFPNTGGVLKSGSKVTLVVGEAHVRDLTVE